MTIEFNCPNCGALIAFGSQHIGKQALCTTCRQKFIIPSENYAAAKKITPPVPVEETIPMAGFWKALFIDSWKIFIDRENTAALAFVAAVTIFKFFLGHAACCCGTISHFIIWGWLFGFYLNLIYETAFDSDQMPEIYLGTSVTFFWYIVKPLFVFVLTTILTFFPFIVCLANFQDQGITMQNMWHHDSQWRYLLLGTFFLGVFVFPMAVLTTAVAQDFLMLLRPDYIFAPIFKAFFPYLAVFILLTSTCLIEMQTKQFDLDAKLSTIVYAGQLAINLAVQVIAIISMRSIGLFYRHFRCHLKW